MTVDPRVEALRQVADVARTLVHAQAIATDALAAAGAVEGNRLTAETLICCDHAHVAGPSCGPNGDGIATLGELIAAYDSPGGGVEPSREDRAREVGLRGQMAYEIVELEARVVELTDALRAFVAYADSKDGWKPGFLDDARALAAADEGEDRASCPNCEGRGTVWQDGEGNCPECGGSGSRLPEPDREWICPEHGVVAESEVAWESHSQIPVHQSPCNRDVEPADAVEGDRPRRCDRCDLELPNDPLTPETRA
jgi:hypothetical protein